MTEKRALNKPAINDMIDKVGCRYMLVTTVACRARQLLTTPDKLGDDKPVSLAVEELYEDKLNVEYPAEYEAK